MRDNPRKQHASDRPDGLTDTLLQTNIPQILEALLGSITGVHYFIKDLYGRHLAASAIMQVAITGQPQGLLGKTDADIYSLDMAEKYRQDDQQVIQSGQAMTGILELFLNEQGVPAWHSTDKFPLYDHHQRIIGVMGTISYIDKHFTELTMCPQLLPAMRYIEQHYHQKFSIERLAQACGISVRTLQRSFQKHLMTSPKQFTIRRRCFEACLLLKAGGSDLSDIAQKTGFYDQSDLSRQFRAVMHMTPMRYRQRYT